MTSFYLAHTSECKKLLFAKLGDRSSSPCHNCLTQQKEIRRNKQTKRIIVYKSLKLLCGKRSFSIANDTICDLPMLPFFPILQKCLLIGVHKSADNYSSLRFEQFHSLLLRSSKMLKDCLLKYLFD